MNKTQHMKRRPLVHMPGHALVLSGKQRAADQQDARRMVMLERMRRGGSVRPGARLLFLAGILR